MPPLVSRGMISFTQMYISAQSRIPFRQLTSQLELLHQSSRSHVGKPACASLLHGDVWSNNVLKPVHDSGHDDCDRDNHPLDFIDPVCFYGDGFCQV